MLRRPHGLHLLLFACLAVGVSACSSPLDAPRQAALESQARQAAAGDVPLRTRLDLTLPAFFEVDYQGQRNQNLRQPACGGYCLRLLYSGEATTVISGFAMPAPDMDCATAEQAARDYHDGKIDRLGFTSKDWDHLNNCKRVEAAAAGGARADPPQLWRASDDGPAYLVRARAYHIEKRKSCPGTAHTDTLRAYPNARGNSTLVDADAIADTNIAAGECLIETPADLDAASATFVFSFEGEDNYDKASLMRDTRFSSSQLTVYGAAAARRPVVYRHTLSQYAYLPVLAPGSTFDSASFFVEKSSETHSQLDHVRSDLGLKLADPSVAKVDYNEAVANALDNPDLDFISPNWNIVRDYLAALKAKGPHGIDAGDARLLARLINDRRVTIQLRDLGDVVQANPQAGSMLAKPLLTALNSFPYEALPNGSARELGNDEEREMIARQGGDHRDLLNAGLERLDSLAAGLAALDDDSVRTQLPLYRELAENQYRARLYPTIVEHMNVLPAAETLPILRGLITPEPVEKQWQQEQAYRRLSALRAVCRMGDAAAPLLPDLVGFLRTTPEPETDGANAGGAEIAWTVLTHFHQADVLAAQLHPAKPYTALMASGRLNCHGWLYPPLHGDTW